MPMRVVGSAKAAVEIAASAAAAESILENLIRFPPTRNFYRCAPARRLANPASVRSPYLLHPSFVIAKTRNEHSIVAPTPSVNADGRRLCPARGNRRLPQPA